MPDAKFRTYQPVSFVQVGLYLIEGVTRLDVVRSVAGDKGILVPSEWQIRRAIADGEAQPGERLPPARDLAAVMGVNANTVLRALRMLRDEGLLEFRRGHSVRVSGTPERGALVAKVHELLDLAGQLGYQRAEVVDMIQRVPHEAHTVLQHFPGR
jgi:GntR family transcriptional regulator